MDDSKYNSKEKKSRKICLEDQILEKHRIKKDAQ